MTTSRETHLVELVDDHGRATGERTVAEAHQPPGLLHRAFSVLLIDPAGRVLLQQRAAVKTRFPLRWANSCCGHPAPGQSLSTAANLRLQEELGVGPVSLSEIGVHHYHAEDPATGRVEFEYDHVLRADFSPDEPLHPDPAEVADLRWVDPLELHADLTAEPQRYAPWLSGVLDRLLNPVPSSMAPHVPAPNGPVGVTDGLVGPAGQHLTADAPERSGGR